MKKNLFILSLFCCTFLSAQQYTQHQKDSLSKQAKISIQQAMDNALVITSLPEINDIIGDNIKQQKTFKTLVHSSQFGDAAFVKYNGVIYTVAWQGSGRVSSISTRDSLFKTDDVSIKTDYKTFKNLYPGKLSRAIRTGYFYKLPSGWNAAFYPEAISGNDQINDDQKITYFFKRTW